jgi:hypothetical protein
MDPFDALDMPQMARPMQLVVKMERSAFGRHFNSSPIIDSSILYRNKGIRRMSAMNFFYYLF